MLEFHFTDQDLDEALSRWDSKTSKLVVHAPEFWERTLVDLCSLDERQRSASRDLMQKTIDLTRRDGALLRMATIPKVIIHPGAMSLDHPITNHAALYENLRRSIQEIDHQGVELLLENLPPHPWYFGGQWLTNAFMDAYEIRDFITSMDLSMCFDTSHQQALLQLGACRFLRAGAGAAALHPSPSSFRWRRAGRRRLTNR